MKKYLKVKDLKNMLKSYEDDTIIFISIDEEGNQLKPLPLKDFYSEEKPWNFDVRSQILDDFEDDERVLVLWPIG